MPRAFIAVDINEEVRGKLVEFQRQLEATRADLKLVEPENIHVTMKFLGEVPESRVPEITEALGASLEGTKGFDIGVRGIGVFPSLRYIRVVWAGVEAGKDELVGIQKKIDLGLKPIGFRPERDFVPHLTLARVRTARFKDKLAAFVNDSADLEFGTSRARAIELKQSTLTQRGPIYSTLARFELV